MSATDDEVRAAAKRWRAYRERVPAGADPGENDDGWPPKSYGGERDCRVLADALLAWEDRVGVIDAATRGAVAKTPAECEAAFRAAGFAPHRLAGGHPSGVWLHPDGRSGVVRSRVTHELDVVDHGSGHAAATHPTGDESRTPPATAFAVGEAVRKVGGDYAFEGVVRGVIVKASGAVRFAVEDARGVLMIYSAKNLERLA